MLYTRVSIQATWILEQAQSQRQRRSRLPFAAWIGPPLRLQAPDISSQRVSRLGGGRQMRVKMHGGGQGFESPAVHLRCAGRSRSASLPGDPPKARLLPPRDPSPCFQVHADGSGWDSAGSNRTTPSDVDTQSLACPKPQP